LSSSNSAASEASSGQRSGAARWIALVSIGALALLLTLHRLGAAGVCAYDEAVEGLFVQQMVEHHAGLFALANGRDAMYKPPLFHWTALAIDRLLGIRKVTGFNLRLPAALYGSACLILIVCFAYTIFGARAALLAALVLLGSYQYVSQARFGRVDMTLTFCETAALAGFLWWLKARRESAQSGRAVVWRWLFALALGLGVLAKGPVGALLPLLSVAVFIMVKRDWNTAATIFSPGSALLALAVGSSWYAACYIAGRYDFLIRQIGSENFGRFFGALGAMAPWYYIEPILLNSLPLSLIAPIAVGAALAAARHAREAPADTALDAAACLAIFWVVCVIFFTLAAYKRRSYLLPLWPPAAVLIAWWIEYRVVPRCGRIVRPAFIAICAALIAFNLVFIPRQEARTCGSGSFQAAAARINRIVGPEDLLFLYRMGDPAALLFYLDRSAPVIGGMLGDAPPGYVIVTAAVWEHERQRAPGLEPVLGPTPGEQPLILLRHGKAYAMAAELTQELEAEEPQAVAAAAGPRRLAQLPESLCCARLPFQPVQSDRAAAAAGFLR
jgi:4-amino-4-deoxy-L-arabinose transferase-like glycosyltransferase